MNRFILLVASLLLISLASCAAPLGEGDPARSGTLAIQLDLPQASGRGFSSATAAAKADVYDVFASNGTSIYCKTVAAGSNLWTLPVGSYKIIALAGKASGSNAHLIGSAEATGIEVSAGNVTAVSLALRCIEVAVSVPTQVNVTTTTSYVASVEVDTKSADLSLTALEMSIAGAGYAGAGTAIDYEATPIGARLGYSATITAPTTASTPSLTIEERMLTLFGHAAWASSIPTTPHTWYFPATATFAEMGPDMTATLNFVTAANTGLSVGIGWA
jgi:hypothetical protein